VNHEYLFDKMQLNKDAKSCTLHLYENVPRHIISAVVQTGNQSTHFIALVTPRVA